MASRFLKAALLFILFFAVFEAGFFFGHIFSENIEEKIEAPFALLGSSQATQQLPSNSLSASVNIVAVTSDGQGMASTGNVEIIQGKGRILFNTNPFVEPDTQSSLETAAYVATVFTQKSLAGKDVIYSVSNTNAQLIGGPSAGAAFTVATIAAMEGKSVRSDAAITGTINKDGSIGQIGGVVEKMNALIAQNAKLFLIPKGQSIVTTYSDQVETITRRGVVYKIHRLVPQQIDLAQVGQQNGLQVVEVSNISEAVKHLIE